MQDWLVIYPYKDLAEKSDLIVIGRPVRELEIVNTARDVWDSSRPSPVDYGVGHVIEVEVEETWQGQAPGTIYVTESGGMLLDGNPGREPTAEELAAAEQVYQIVRLQMGERYVFLLRCASYSYSQIIDQAILYTPTYMPQWFRIRADGCAVVESRTEFEDEFPPQLLQTLRQRLEEKVDYPAGPGTLSPQPDPECVESGQAYPIQPLFTATPDIIHTSTYPLSTTPPITETPIPPMLENGWYLYNDTEAGYSFSYPADAHFMTSRDSGINYDIVSLQFEIPDANGYQGMEIMVIDNPEQLPVENVLQRIYSNPTDIPRIESIRATLGKITIAGLHAYKSTYRPSMYELTILIPHQDKIYYFLPVHDNLNLLMDPRGLKLFFEILDTFELVGP